MDFFVIDYLPARLIDCLFSVLLSLMLQVILYFTIVVQKPFLLFMFTMSWDIGLKWMSRWHYSLSILSHEKVHEKNSDYCCLLLAWWKHTAATEPAAPVCLQPKRCWTIAVTRLTCLRAAEPVFSFGPTAAASLVHDQWKLIYWKIRVDLAEASGAVSAPLSRCKRVFREITYSTRLWSFKDVFNEAPLSH